jgi:biotin carboxyl carrier protein
MKKYKVIVNGTAYEVEIEEMSASDIKSQMVKPSTVEEESNTTPSAPSGAEQVKSPIPGVVLNINVTNGQNVKRGQVLLILESMKMENEILAPIDGKVTLNVIKGANVSTDDLLCVIV